MSKLLRSASRRSRCRSRATPCASSRPRKTSSRRPCRRCATRTSASPCSSRTTADPLPARASGSTSHDRADPSATLRRRHHGLPQERGRLATGSRPTWRRRATGRAPPSSADLLLVNTCGFIDAAKQESIDVLLTPATRRTRAAPGWPPYGCLIARHEAELRARAPRDRPLLAGSTRAPCSSSTPGAGVPAESGGGGGAAAPPAAARPTPT